MFRDRRDAGRQLAVELMKLDLPDPLVLALPRGGVSVAVEIAKALRCPLDLVLVRKIGSPGHAELAAGAVVDGEVPVLVRNEDVIRVYGIDEAWLESERRHQLDEIERRRALYLGNRPRAGIAGRTAIVVDDGIATGATVRAALQAVRASAPREIVLAVPIAAPDVLDDLAATCDRTVCLDRNPYFSAVGQAYRDFTQVEDEEVIAMLAEVPAG